MTDWERDIEEYQRSKKDSVDAVIILVILFATIIIVALMHFIFK